MPRQRIVAPPPHRGRSTRNLLAVKGLIGRGDRPKRALMMGVGITSIDRHRLLRAVLQKGERGEGDLLFDPEYGPRRVGGVLRGVMPWISFSATCCIRSNVGPLPFPSNINLYWRRHPPRRTARPSSSLLSYWKRGRGVEESVRGKAPAPL